MTKRHDTPSKSRKHKCRRPDTCTCETTDLEPREHCPKHGIGDWPPRCGDCGKFMKYEGAPCPICGEPMPYHSLCCTYDTQAAPFGAMV